MPSAIVSAATLPPVTLFVERNEVQAVVLAAESMPMTLMFAATAVMGAPRAVNCVGAITMAAGFSAAAFSSAVISPEMSASLWAPSSGTLMWSSLPAWRAPASTICQYCEVVSFTITGIVCAWTGACQPATAVSNVAAIRVLVSVFIGGSSFFRCAGKDQARCSYCARDAARMVIEKPGVVGGM